MARLDELFRYLKEHKGSDLHLAAGLEPRIRRHGHLEQVPKWPILSDAALQDLLREIPSARQWEHYERNLDLDFAYGLDGVARFRANYLHQENGVGAVFRIIPEEIIPLEKLNLPPATQGLAPSRARTGAGDGTHGFGQVDHLGVDHRQDQSRPRPPHRTIEDPIEFVHPNKRSTISQREVGTDTESFAAALRAAIRQDPNVILVGELRDFETIALAITAAEMGVLVFGTLHTNSASKTIDRVIDVFPATSRAKCAACWPRRSLGWPRNCFCAPPMAKAV